MFARARHIATLTGLLGAALVSVAWTALISACSGTESTDQGVPTDASNEGAADAQDSGLDVTADEFEEPPVDAGWENLPAE